MKFIGFTKVALPYGWLGNMSPHPIKFEGKEWRTAEALFQALRFNDESIREKIRAEKSPMGAKFRAKANRDKMVVLPLSEEDIKNMELCISLKLETYPMLREELKKTGDSVLYENVSSRARGNNLFWGAILNGSKLEGENQLGKIWMKFRANL